MAAYRHARHLQSAVAPAIAPALVAQLREHHIHSAALDPAAPRDLYAPLPFTTATEVRTTVGDSRQTVAYRNGRVLLERCARS